MPLVNIDDLSEAEEDLYFEALLTSETCQINAIGYFTKEKRRTSVPGERAELGQKIAEAERNLAVLASKRGAADNGSAMVNRPTDSDVAALKAILTAVQEQTQNTRVWQAVADLTISALNSFRDVHPGDN